MPQAWRDKGRAYRRLGFDSCATIIGEGQTVAEYACSTGHQLSEVMQVNREGTTWTIHPTTQPTVSQVRMRMLSGAHCPDYRAAAD